MAMIYLKENFLLDQPLNEEHVKVRFQGDRQCLVSLKIKKKERLLGHWGTCPGLNLIYAHMNLLIKRHSLDSFIIVGPGHGAPALLANLWAEGSLGKFWEQYRRNKDGIVNLIKGFSWPGGFPRYNVSSPSHPGTT